MRMGVSKEKASLLVVQLQTDFCYFLLQDFLRNIGLEVGSEAFETLLTQQ